MAAPITVTPTPRGVEVRAEHWDGIRKVLLGVLGAVFSVPGWMAVVGMIQQHKGYGVGTAILTFVAVAIGIVVGLILGRTTLLLHAEGLDYRVGPLPFPRSGSVSWAEVASATVRVREDRDEDGSARLSFSPRLYLVSGGEIALGRFRNEATAQALCDVILSRGAPNQT